MQTMSVQDLVDEDVTADAVLRAHFSLSSLDGALECIHVDGATGWTSPNPHPALSLMRWTTVDPECAASALDIVLDRFRRANRKLEWMTGPNCADAGLLSLLTSRGFDPEPMYVAAMSKTLDADELFDTTDGVKTVKVSQPDDLYLGRVMARGFAVPDEVGEIYHRAYRSETEFQVSDVYAASLGASDETVGVGYLTYLGKSKNVMLRASSVLESGRGNGAYKALVFHRLRDAAERGYKEAFVHAYSKESRTGLAGIGFRTLGGLALHSWSPET